MSVMPVPEMMTSSGQFSVLVITFIVKSLMMRSWAIGIINGTTMHVSSSHLLRRSVDDHHMAEETKEHEIPIAPVFRLIKSATKHHVSAKASIELRNILEELGSIIASRAKELSDHRNATTVRMDDIRLSCKHFNEKKKNFIL